MSQKTIKTLGLFVFASVVFLSLYFIYSQIDYKLFQPQFSDFFDFKIAMGLDLQRVIWLSIFGVFALVYFYGKNFERTELLQKLLPLFVVAIAWSFSFNLLIMVLGLIFMRIYTQLLLARSNISGYKTEPLFYFLLLTMTLIIYHWSDQKRLVLDQIEVPLYQPKLLYFFAIVVLFRPFSDLLIDHPLRKPVFLLEVFQQGILWCSIYIYLFQRPQESTHSIDTVFLSGVSIAYALRAHQSNYRKPIFMLWVSTSYLLWPYLDVQWSVFGFFWMISSALIILLNEFDWMSHKEGYLVRIPFIWTPFWIAAVASIRSFSGQKAILILLNVCVLSWICMKTFPSLKEKQSLKKRTLTMVLVLCLVFVLGASYESFINREGTKEGLSHRVESYFIEKVFHKDRWRESL